MSYKQPLGSGIELQCLLYQSGPNFISATESRSYSFEVFTRSVNPLAPLTEIETELCYRERRPPCVDKEQIVELEKTDPAVGAKLRAWAAEESVAVVDPENAEVIFRLLQDASIPTLWPAEVSILDGSRHNLSIRRGDTVVSLSWYEMPEEYARIGKLLKEIIELAAGYTRF